MTGSHVKSGRASTLLPASSLSRRTFFGAVGAMAMTRCDEGPPEKIIPYVRRPPHVVPGRPEYYATSTTRGGYGVGLVVESHEGRPTKIEGHPEHPASRGKTFAREQAEILSLYDPDRAQDVRRFGEVESWKRFMHAFGQSPSGREVLLLEPTASPLVGALLEQVRRARPDMEVFFNPSQAPTSRWRATKEVFGQVLEPHLDLERARVILSLDSDFLTDMPMSIRWASDFASTRATSSPDDEMTRLYVVESAVTVTGASSDHRLPLRASDVGRFAAALHMALTEDRPDAEMMLDPKLASRLRQSLSGREQRWVRTLAADLKRHHGSCVVIVGDRQPQEVHAIGMALNQALGAIGTILTHTRSPILGAGTRAYSIEQCMRAFDAPVKSAYVLGGNPTYELSPALDFSSKLRRASNLVYLSQYFNETAEHATWHLAETHFLESWGTTRSPNGTLSLRQPLLRPLFAGRSTEEVLAVLAGQPMGGRQLLERHFEEQFGSSQSLTEALARGIVDTPTFPEVSVQLRPSAIRRALTTVATAEKAPGLELNFACDPRVGDGRMTNNRWLLELPEPITKLVWDNALLLSPVTAAELGVQRGDVVRLRTARGSVEAPALPVRGHARDACSMWLGWGRRGTETSARGVGSDASPLRELGNPWITHGLELNKTGRTHHLVTTQEEHDLHGRSIFLHETKQRWKANPDFAKHHREPLPSLLPDRSSGSPQWGMTIDLSRCTGCSACVIACQAENNIPTVGKEMVALGREMHWLRIDAYHGSSGHPPVMLQPMLCQHCEKAPCEYVCPVNATSHSHDGINEMTYNRCVGTRFCSNNCPYKVRRFNFYDYNSRHPETVKMVFNPNVTVRARGVMEKCTYCVQRIRRTEIDARLENRRSTDGEIRTACEQVCPSDAITFGSVADGASRVSRAYANKRTYSVLGEVGTQPRTRYMARISNLNPELTRDDRQQ